MLYLFNRLSILPIDSSYDSFTNGTADTFIMTSTKIRLSLCNRLSSIAVASFLALFGGWVQAHEWTDNTGSYKVTGTLIALDDKEVVIKLDKPTKGRELLAFPIDKLSEADLKYIESEEVTKQIKGDGDKHSWKLRNGMTVLGKVVDFAKKDVTIQRRRGKVYVNDRPMENLPEIYRKLVPHVVEHFEGIKFKDDREFTTWLARLKGESKTFKCEGVMFELANGDEYALPFFVFVDEDLKSLQPSWDKWIAAHGQAEETQEQQRQHALYLQSQASAYQQQQQQNEMMQIARLQLQLSAVQTGIVDIWEVYLFPPDGVAAYPMSVVVTASNSDVAARIAMQNNPGFIAGSARKVSSRRF